MSRECLLDDEISSLLTMRRTVTGIASLKLLEIQHSDLLDYRPIEGRLAGFDACFFCLGISSAGIKEADYERLTYDIMLAAPETLNRLNPDMVFTYVSGAATNSSEHGRIVWARVNGSPENALLKLPFKGAYMMARRYSAHVRGGLKNQVLPVAVRGHGTGPTDTPMNISGIDLDNRDRRSRDDPGRQRRLTPTNLGRGRLLRNRPRVKCHRP